MALKGLGVFNLSLSKIVEADETIFVTRKDELVLSDEVRVDACGNLVVGEDSCLSRHTLHVKDSDLVVSAAGNQRSSGSPRHGLNSSSATHGSDGLHLRDRGASTLVAHGLRVGINLSGPNLGVDFPQVDANVGIVDDLGGRDKLLGSERVLGKAGVAT